MLKAGQKKVEPLVVEKEGQPKRVPDRNGGQHTEFGDPDARANAVAQHNQAAFANAGTGGNAPNLVSEGVAGEGLSNVGANGHSQYDRFGDRGSVLLDANDNNNYGNLQLSPSEEQNAAVVDRSGAQVYTKGPAKPSGRTHAYGAMDVRSNDIPMNVLGQSNVEPNNVSSNDERQAKNKASKLKKGLYGVAGVTTVLGALSGLGSLIWMISSGTGIQSDEKAKGKPRVFDHTVRAKNNTTKVTINVIDNAEIDGGNIDKSSVQFLKELGSANPVHSDSVDLGAEGKWEKGPSDGEISFTPGVKKTHTAFVYFRVADDSSPPVYSNTAMAVVVFDVDVKPDPHVNDDAPIVGPLVSEGNEPGATVTFDVLKTVVKGIASIDKDSVKITSGLDDGKTLQVFEQGIWTVEKDTGIVTFKPDPKLKGNPSPVRYSVADTMGLRSSDSMLRIEYTAAVDPDLPPIARNITVHKYEFDSRMPPTAGQPLTPRPSFIYVKDYVVKTANDIDFDSVAFLNTMTPVGANTGATPTYSNPVKVNNKDIGFGKVTIDKQGVFEIKDSLDKPPQKQIVFTPETGVLDTPTGVSYVIADTKGRVSKPSLIVLYREIDKLFEMADALDKKDDATFWTDVENEFLQKGQELDDFVAAVLALRTLTLGKMDKGESGMLLDLGAPSKQIIGSNFTTLFKEWAKGGLTPDLLYQIATREVTDKSLGVKLKHAVRVSRLDLMRRLYRVYLGELTRATGRQS